MQPRLSRACLAHIPWQLCSRKDALGTIRLMAGHQVHHQQHGSHTTAIRCSSSSNAPVCPTEPGPEDCCQSGCENCVWTVYRQELNNYMAYMRKHHPTSPTPAKKAGKQQMVEASMDAFEQLERQLLMQQQQQQQQQQEQQQEQQAASAGS